MPRRTVIEKTGGAGVDARDFRVVAKALRMAAPELAKELRKDLRAAGEVVAEKAREIAKEHSQTIPPTIKVRVVSTTVSVVAGGEKAPIGALFELGNTGGSKSASASRSGKFRHPVFGNRNVWVAQDMHPFLAPAAETAAPQFTAEFTRSLDKVTRTIVFGGRQ